MINNPSFSGRTEKQAVRDAQMKVRTPPSFSRTPSRRYQRRIVEGMVERTFFFLIVTPSN